MVWVIQWYVQTYPFVDGGGVCWNKFAPGEDVVVCADINEGGGGSVCILHSLQSYWYAIIVAWAILVILAKKNMDVQITGLWEKLKFFM